MTDGPEFYLNRFYRKIVFIMYWSYLYVYSKVVEADEKAHSDLRVFTVGGGVNSIQSASFRCLNSFGYGLALLVGTSVVCGHERLVMKWSV